MNRRHFLASTAMAAVAMGVRPSFADAAKAAEILKGSGSMIVSTWHPFTPFSRTGPFWSVNEKWPGRSASNGCSAIRSTEAIASGTEQS